MRFSIKIIGFVLLYSSITTYAQEQSRRQKIEEVRKLDSKIEQMQDKLAQAQERQENIRKEIISVSDEDKAEAERLDAEVFRLFPDKIIDDITEYPDGASIYIFEQVARFYFAPRIEYKNNSLEFVKDKEKNLGFIAEIGGISIETIDEQNREVIALAQYQPPPEFKDAKSDYISNKLTFGSKVAVTAGNTYLARVISYGEGDAIFALKILRKDTDESIIVFIKKIKTFDPPQLKKDALTTQNQKQDKPSVAIDYETVQKVQNAVLQKGFIGVTVDGSTIPMTVRGTVPKGKLAEVIQLVIETNGGKPVRNEITEQ